MVSGDTEVARRCYEDRRTERDRRIRQIMCKWEEVAGKLHRAESNPRSRSKRTVTKQQTRLGIEGSFLAFSTVRNQRTRDLARVHKGSLPGTSPLPPGKNMAGTRLRGERFLFLPSSGKSTRWDLFNPV